MGASLLMLWPFPWMYTYTFGSDALIGIVVYLWSRNNPGTSGERRCVQTHTSIENLYIHSFCCSFVDFGAAKRYRIL